MVEPLVFANTVEGLYVRGIGQGVTPELRLKLRAEGLDLDRDLLPGYPLASFKRFLRLTAQTLYPGYSLDEGYRKIGHRFIGGYFETIVGRALKPLLKILGPQRSLIRMTQNLRGGNNFSESRTEVLAPADVRMWVNDALADSPGFMRGLLEEGIRQVYSLPSTVEVEKDEVSGVTFRVRW